MIKNVRGHGKVWYTTSTFLTEEAAMEQFPPALWRKQQTNNGIKAKCIQFN